MNKGEIDLTDDFPLNPGYQVELLNKPGSEHPHDIVIRMAENNDIPGLIAIINTKWRDPNDIVMASAIYHSIWYLLYKGKIYAVFMIALSLSKYGYQSPVIAFALSIGGLLYNDDQAEKRGIEALAASSQQMTQEQYVQTYGNIVLITAHRLLNVFIHDEDNGKTLRLLEIIKIVDPCLRSMFDWDVSLPPLLQKPWHQPSHEPNKQITYPLPPSVEPRQQRRVLVTGRGVMVEELREPDSGPRIVHAMNQYGWQTEFLSIVDGVNWWQIIPEICRQHNIDVLIIEDDLICMNELTRRIRAQMIDEVRHDNPHIKVGGYLCDSWVQPAILKETSRILDFIWDFTSFSLSIWKEPNLAHKMICLPCPFTDIFGSTNQPLIPELFFSGSVKGFNWHRAFWVAATNHLKLPVNVKITAHLQDGLPVLESFALYMQSLTESTCCLNFTMRPDINHSRIVTGRSFEAILSGALLVQELTPDMHHFFVPGKHYLEFSSISELSAIVQFIRENREKAEEIRRCGYEFAKEQYNDEKLIGYLEKHIFYSN